MAAGNARAGKAYIELGVRSKMSAGLKAAQRRLESFGKRVKAVSDRINQVGDRINQVGVRLSAMGLAAGAGIGFAAKTFADFDDQMRLLKAVTGATSDEFEKLTEQAKLLGRTTSFTASQVAAGMVEMGRAGFQSSEILVATEQVLALSRATATELPRAAEIAGAALRGFALPASEMERVVNVLSTAVNGSAQTLEDFFEGVKFVAPVAAEAGASIEDVSAAMAILANNGIKGSLAGNALTRAYKNLSTELKQSELAEFGVEAVDAAGNLRPLSSIIADLGTATDGLGSAKRLAVFESLFGRGQASALKLASSGAQFDDIRDGLLNIEKTAVDVAEEMNSGLGGAFRSLGSAAEGTTIAIGDALSEPLQRLSERIGQVLGYLTEWINTNPGVVVSVAKVTAAVLAAGAGLIALSVAASGVSVAISGAAVAMKGVGVALAVLGVAKAAALGLAAALAAIGPAAMAAGAAAAAITTAWVTFGVNANGAIARVGTSLRNLKYDAMVGWEGVVAAINAGDLEKAAEIAMTGFEIVFKTAINRIADFFYGVMTDFAQYLVVLRDTAREVTSLGLASTNTDLSVALIQNIDIARQRSNEAEVDALRARLRKLRDESVDALEQRREDMQRADEGEDSGRRRPRQKAWWHKSHETEPETPSSDPLTIDVEMPEVTLRDVAMDGDALADAIEDVLDAASAGLGQAENLRTMTRGTFSAFAAGRIGTANTYEDQSLKAQQETAQAVKSIDRKVGPTTIGI